MITYQADLPSSLTLLILVLSKAASISSNTKKGAGWQLKKRPTILKTENTCTYTHPHHVYTYTHPHHVYTYTHPHHIYTSKDNLYCKSTIVSSMAILTSHEYFPVTCLELQCKFFHTYPWMAKRRARAATVFSPPDRLSMGRYLHGMHGKPRLHEAKQR